MSNKNHIDKIFKEALHEMEATPDENLWNNISDDILENNVDKQFRDALGHESIQPSDEMWDEIKEHLPLNLKLKRSLSYLSVVAGVVVIGMLLIVAFDLKEQKEKSSQEDLKPNYNIEIAIEELQEVDPVIQKNNNNITPSSNSLVLDRSIKDNIKSVELKEEEEFVFNVDVEKMKEIMEPIRPFKPGNALVSKGNNTIFLYDKEEGIVAPQQEEVILVQEEIVEDSISAPLTDDE